MAMQSMPTPPQLQGRRDLQFASHTVRGKCEQVLAEFDESSESSRQIDRCTDLAGRPDGTEATDEGRDCFPSRSMSTPERA